MTNDKSVCNATGMPWEAPNEQNEPIDRAEFGGKDKTCFVSRFADGIGINKDRGVALEGRRQPTRGPAISMIVTGLALLIVHSVIVILLAYLGGVR